MTLLADDISIFGNAVPTVYIKTVTLDSTSVIQTTAENRISPHVNNKGPGASDMSVNFEQTDSVNYRVTSDSGMLINVDFLLKENLGNSFSDIGTTWSDKATLQKYIMVKTKLIDNSLVSKYLQNISDTNPYAPHDPGSMLNFLHVMSQLALQGLLSETDKEQLIHLGFQKDGPKGVNPSGLSFGAKPYMIDVVPGPNAHKRRMEAFDQFKELIHYSTVETQTINLKKAMDGGAGINYGGNKALAQYAEADEDGKKVINYQFTKTFGYEKSKSDFLCVHANCELAVSSLIDDFGLDPSFANSYHIPRGKVSVQNILVNNKPSAKSCVYYLKEDNSVWTGHFHKVDIAGYGGGGAQYMTGLTPSPNSKELVKQIVNNTTVQDFRTVDRISKLKFDLSFMQNDTFSLAEARKYTRDRVDVLKQPAYFSKNYVSRGYDGAAKFLFGVDFYSLARDQTLFGNILEAFPSHTNMQKARQFFDLLNIKVIRRRVDVVPQANRLGTYNPQEIPFKTGYLGEPHIDTEEIVRQVVSAKEDLTNGGFQTLKLQNVSSTTNSSIDTINFSVPDNEDPALKSKGFIFFTGKDMEVKLLTDGHYQYGVEMEILDKSREYIIGYINKLMFRYKALKGYYNFATQSGKTYNVKTGRFRKVLANYYSKLVESGQIPASKLPHQSAAQLLVNICHEFKDEKDIFDTNAVFQQLVYISSPDTGTPRGVETLLSLILNAMTKLSEMVGATLNMPFITQLTSQLDPLGNPTNVNKTDGNIFSKNPSKRIIKIQNYFDEAFDTEVPKGFGYDFLAPLGKSDSTLLSSGPGLVQLQGDAFNSRLRLETTKYFNSIEPENFEITDLSEGIDYTPGDTVFTSLFSYLTPAAINLGTGKTNPILTETVGGNNLGVGKNRYSLLPSNPTMGGNKYLFNKKAFSYIATKIINYNINNTIPAYDSTILGQSVLSEYEHRLKFYTNQILAERNCLAAISKKASNNNSDGEGMFLTNYLGDDFDNVDSLADNQLNTIALFDDPTLISYKGGAENSLFLSLIYGGSNQCSGIASTKSPSNIVNKKESYFNLEFFNLQETADTEDFLNILKKISQITQNSNSSEVLPPEQDPTGGGNTVAEPQIQEQLRRLPNQIKSLLLQSNTKAQVKHKWNQLAGNSSQDPYYKASLAINYRNIKRIEYCAGFQYGQSPNADGVLKPQIGQPVWKILDENSYSSAIGKTLFCRLRTYKKAEFGIVPMECLEIPLFDEYFLISPADYQGVLTVIEAPTVYEESVARNVDNTLEVKTGFLATSEYQDDSDSVPPLTQYERNKLHRVLLEDGVMSEVEVGTRLEKAKNLREI